MHPKKPLRANILNPLFVFCIKRFSIRLEFTTGTFSTPDPAADLVLHKMLMSHDVVVVDFCRPAHTMVAAVIIAYTT
jgi:hypothetical protein